MAVVWISPRKSGRRLRNLESIRERCVAAPFLRSYVLQAKLSGFLREEEQSWSPTQCLVQFAYTRAQFPSQDYPGSPVLEELKLLFGAQHHHHAHVTSLAAYRRLFIRICVQCSLPSHTRYLARHFPISARDYAGERGFRRVKNSLSPAKFLGVKPVPLRHNSRRCPNGGNRAQEEVKRDLETLQAVITDIFKCGVCFGMLRETVMCPSGHPFCKPCLERWLGGHSTCPACRRGMRAANMVPGRFIDDFLSEALVRCPNGERPGGGYIQARDRGQSDRD
ncbi:hypothetical protein Bbelb_143820 [Branchiostoma belcheri]|nr:hypothetical protein Bbelb_143820 [Branchiostoma belcheri]